MGSSLPTQTANSQLKASSCYSREGTGQDSIQRHNQTLLSSFEASVSKTKQPTRTNQPLAMAVSKIRQNYHEECEALINKQINMEFYASYVYLSMASYFARDDIALHGFAGHFRTESGEERAHGMKLMDYQNQRGGKVVFQDTAKPSSMEWGSPLDAMEAALELEKTVNQSLLDLHKASDGDAHLCDFLEGEFLGEQVDAIKEISGWITKMKRAGPGIGFHLIDKEIGS